MNQPISENKKNVYALALSALGIVYGDIGTSPLYSMNACLNGLQLNVINIMGVLSLIFWALILIISVKFLCIVLRADNDGEGGILALLALLKRKSTESHNILFIVGLIGAGLLIGDGMLTPAISVLSAVEGLEVLSPSFTDLVLPLTFIILIVLFLSQHHGTKKIGKYFGPVILIWFFTLACLGIIGILHSPEILYAVDPYYAYLFFLNNGWVGYTLLGGVFLVVTGGEALYADLGHFGKNPIRVGWFFIALPALLLNYFGQGANLLHHPEAIQNPFYSIAPSWFISPLIILATIATIIASQAIITATFSLTKQAILLDLAPRLPIIQTSETEKGQIYVPQMNALLAIGTLSLVIFFKSSSALTHAYGIAVNLEMIGLTIIVTTVARIYWKWSLLKIILIFSSFLFIELAFLGANSQKLATGGWIPLSFAVICATVMITWYKGIEFLHTSFHKNKGKITDIFESDIKSDLNYLPKSTVVFITDPYDVSGTGLTNYLKLNKIIPKQIIIVSIVVENHPYMKDEYRYEVTLLHDGMYRLNLHYGFMEVVNIPEALILANNKEIFPFPLIIKKITFLIEIAYVTATRRQDTLMFFWQEQLFAFLMRNSVQGIEFYKLPYNRTIAMGTYFQI
ncbi:MAG: KUP/HAK/KT family potassium transporter [Gammaproteobacteria bacterium]|nr:KUP/HAK/KT family potassium transporter [Gammaproteobacteria bacterium]